MSGFGCPNHIGFAFFQRLFLFVAFAHFQFVQFGFQHFHCGGFVGVLRTVVLTLNHNPCRLVGNTHGGVGFVNVLTACTGCAVSVDTQIGRVDFNFDGASISG